MFNALAISLDGVPIFTLAIASHLPHQSARLSWVLLLARLIFLIAMID